MPAAIEVAENKGMLTFKKSPMQVLLSLRKMTAFLGKRLCLRAQALKM